MRLLSPEHRGRRTHDHSPGRHRHSAQASRRNPVRAQTTQRHICKSQPGGARTIRRTSQRDHSGRLRTHTRPLFTMLPHVGLARHLEPHLQTAGVPTEQQRVNSKGARMKEARNGLLFSTFKRLKNKRFFMMHTLAMVPPHGLAGTSRAFLQRIAPSPSPPQNMRPLRLPDPCPLAQTPVIVCKVSGPPVLCYASHWLLGPRCSATHTSRGYSRRALLALGLRWVLMYSLSSANTILQQKISASFFFFF